ncbi:MAG: hypothetical protein PHW04_15310 [Candidatus Wallbacteria bacterium]|nr:hypothetical protein [Candidatus Wallbacteria bacterium]
MKNCFLPCLFLCLSLFQHSAFCSEQKSEPGVTAGNTHEMNTEPSPVTSEVKVITLLKDNFQLIKDKPALSLEIYLAILRMMEKDKTPDAEMEKHWNAFSDFKTAWFTEIAKTPDQALSDFNSQLLDLDLPQKKLNLGISCGLDSFRKKQEFLKVNPLAELQNSALWQLRDKLYDRFQARAREMNEDDRHGFIEDTSAYLDKFGALADEYKNNAKSFEVLKQLAAFLRLDYKNFLTSDQLNHLLPLEKQRL